MAKQELSGQEEALLNYDELKKLYRPPTAIRRMIYDFILWSFHIIFDCFFREIRSRGAFRLPKKGPVIFVAAPHANQFVDPIVLQNQVHKETGRRISFLIAMKSFKRPFVGTMAKYAMAIPVQRAQDNLKLARGTVTMDPEDKLRVVGDKDTVFTQDCQPRGLLALPKSLGVGQIGEIINDHELYLRKPFRYTNGKTRAAGEKLFKQGTAFKTAAKIDQSAVYAQVFEHLAQGHSLGVFSEGGSHDRPDLLPLKAGVAIMALGAMDANPGCSVKIVPCGMNYFHPHKFRSRAVVEFGPPIEISQSLVDMYADPETTKDAIRELLSTITKALKAVTVTCPDFDTLMMVQTARRLYSNSIERQMSAPAIVDMNRRLMAGYMKYQGEPKIQELRKAVLQYDTDLRSFHIPDHLVEQETRERSKISCATELSAIIVRVLVLGALALPGAILFSPVFLTAKLISEKKRGEALAGSTVKIQAKDVIATWKILVSMGFAPVLYTFYAVVGTLYLKKRFDIVFFLIFYVLCVLITYSALTFGDKGMDLIRLIKPTWLNLVNNEGFAHLRLERRELAKEITSVINEYGPQMYPDFNVDKYGKLSREKRHKEKYGSEEAYEEAKTQKLRQRRARRHAKKHRHAKPVNVGEIPILPDDSSSSGIGLSSSSSSEFEVVSGSEGEYESTGVSKSVDLVREKMISKNREEEE